MALGLVLGCGLMLNAEYWSIRWAEMRFIYVEMGGLVVGYALNRPKVSFSANADTTVHTRETWSLSQ